MNRKLVIKISFLIYLPTFSLPEYNIKKIGFLFKKKKVGKAQ